MIDFSERHVDPAGEKVLLVRDAPRSVNEIAEQSKLLALNASIEGVYADKTFADTQIPLHIIATDLMTGARVALSEGLIVNAIRASIAIPLVLPPKRLGGRVLIDGGASDPLPISVAMAEGCDLILAMV